MEFTILIDYDNLCQKRLLRDLCTCNDCKYDRIMKILFSENESRDEKIRKILLQIGSCFGITISSYVYGEHDLPKNSEFWTSVQKRVYRRLMQDLYDWCRN